MMIDGIPAPGPSIFTILEHYWCGYLREKNVFIPRDLGAIFTPFLFLESASVCKRVCVQKRMCVKNSLCNSVCV